MDWLDSVWAVISPYLEPVIQFLVSTGAGSAIAMLLCSRFLKKNNSDIISSEVAEKIVGKDVVLNLETVSKEQLNNIKTTLLASFGEIFEYIKLTTELTRNMGKVMLKFKAVSEDEKTALLEAINNLERVQNLVITEKEPAKAVTVKLEKVEEKPNTDNDMLF